MLDLAITSIQLVVTVVHEGRPFKLDSLVNEGLIGYELKIIINTLLS